MRMKQSATFRVVESYLSSLDCPRSLAIWILFKENEHVQLTNLDIDVNHYSSPEDFRLAYLATKFLSKAEFLSTKIDLKSVALDKFYEAENACRDINLRGYHWTTIRSGPGERLHNAIIRKIDNILGEYDGDEFVDSANWGPGVSLDVFGTDTSSTNKFRNDRGTTRPLDNLMCNLYAVAYPSWNLQERKIHAGNKIVTVPKNSKTHRTIAIEPGLNLWFQKSVGKMIRRRLSRVGLNLNSQERNQGLSRLAAKFNHLATVDFSSASDTIAESTVRELLPNRWFLLMDLLRSKCGSVGKTSIRYEKFSSMGNGFTFELESLIFYSIAICVCKHLKLSCREVSVYGDDVVIPIEAYPLFVRTSEFYGFSVNSQKSYSSGYFRESCGAHWYDTINCKPYFLRKLISSESSVYLAANSIRRLSRNHYFEFCDIRFLQTWRLLRFMVRKPLLISEGYGDGGFISNFDEARPSRAKNCIEGYYSYSMVDVPIRYFSDDHPILLARLKGFGTEVNLGNETNLRGRVRRKRKRLFVRRWENLGPWF